jgi:predicted nucleic acid-binding protein
MELNSVIIDTNAYSEFKKGNKGAVSILRNVNAIILTPIVIGELMSGFIIGNRESINRKEFEEFKQSKRVITVQINDETSEYFALIFKELRDKGKPVPTNDLWIAAIARQIDCPIFTYDKHFQYIKGVKIISGEKQDK